MELISSYNFITNLPWQAAQVSKKESKSDEESEEDSSSEEETSEEEEASKTTKKSVMTSFFNGVIYRYVTLKIWKFVSTGVLVWSDLASLWFLG